MKKQVTTQMQKWSLWFYLAWSAGIVFVGGLTYIIVLMPPRAEHKQLGQAFQALDQKHIGVGEDHPAYNSNPPTSGYHYSLPAPWGVTTTELPDEQVVHNLEHGGIWITYQNIDDQTKKALENLTRSQTKMIMTPRTKDDSLIVVASWGRVQKFQSYDERAILAFIDANRNKSPEPLAQ